MTSALAEAMANAHLLLKIEDAPRLNFELRHQSLQFSTQLGEFFAG